jgi:DNA-binding transcriptional MerR regulator
MNTSNTNKVQNSYDSDNEFAQKPRITSSSSINMPTKKVKKAKDAFRTISEVADKLNVQQHVLRFWETKFSQVRPLKRGGGRRYYRPEDVALLERIHHLLYTEGYTIKGVQKLLKGQGKQQIIANAKEEAPAPVAASPKVQTEGAAKPQKMDAQTRAALEIMLAELKAMRALIKV